MITYDSIIWDISVEGIVFSVGANFDALETVEDHSTMYLASQILRELVDEEIASFQDETVIVPHQAIAQLDLDAIRALGLPDSYPYQVEVKVDGRLTDKGVHYTYHFINGKSVPFVNPTRLGSYIEITPDQAYLLLGDTYNLLDAIDRFNGGDTQNRNIKSNLLSFAKIKGLAKETGAELDAYLNKEDVLVPDKLSVRLQKSQDGELEVLPYLSQEGDGEQIVAALDEKTAEQFINVFDRFKAERDLYAVPNGPRIVFSDEQKEALKQFKKLRKVSGEEKEAFLKTPQAFFDPDVVHLEDFSQRVKEIGEYQPRVFPFLKPQKEPWLPPEGGLVIDGTTVFLDEKDASTLKARIENAIANNTSSVTWKGQEIPANAETLDSVESLISEKERIKKEKRADSEVGQNTKKILIIADNFDQENYGSNLRSRPGVLARPLSLKPEVSLLPHQEEGIKWLQHLWFSGWNGALLADDMGLGKTLQALAFLAWVRELMDKGLYPEKPVLIVAPVTLLENWASEYDKFLNPIFGPVLQLHSQVLRQFKNQELAHQLNIRKETDIRESSTLQDLIGSVRGMLLDHKEISRAGLVLTTYETVRDYQFSLGLIEWAVMVLDEAQKVKTPSAMVTMASKAMNYDFGLSMTGTPVENSWVDLWSIVDFSQPGLLGSLKDFVGEYQNPLRKADTDREALGNQLKEKVNPVLKRRMKEEHLSGLPQKKIHVLPEKMPDVQLERYMDVVNQARAKVPDKYSGNKTHIFSTIAALRDISLCPFLPFCDDQALAELSVDELLSSSARIQKTLELLHQIAEKEEKVIVFVISRKMQRIFQRIIKKQFGISAYIINGTVAGGRRKELVDKFQNTVGFNVILMSTEAAGVGLNVTAANHVIHLSRAWNPAKEDQATDRVFRIGQDKDVEVYLPMAVHPKFDNDLCRGSFDEKLNRLLDYKRKLSQSVLLPAAVEDGDWVQVWEEIVGIDTQAHAGEVLNEKNIDRLSPDLFEVALTLLYEKMGYDSERTPQSGDFGADVVALGKDGDDLLIQCKHTAHSQKAQGNNGIKEVLNAKGRYEVDYQRTFKLMVATNAEGFSGAAEKLARTNQVELLSRVNLMNQLGQYAIKISELVV